MDMRFVADELMQQPTHMYCIQMCFRKLQLVYSSVLRAICDWIGHVCGQLIAINGD